MGVTLLTNEIGKMKATQKSIKERNIGLLLKFIREEKKISRIKLSKKTKLAKSTVSELTKYLIKRKVIFEDKKAESKMGKKPTLLKFNKDHLCYSAINIGIKDIDIAIVNSFGGIINKVKLADYPRKNRDAPIISRGYGVT